jgi:protein-disulfide isomerase
MAKTNPLNGSCVGGTAPGVADGLVRPVSVGCSLRNADFVNKTTPRPGLVEAVRPPSCPTAPQMDLAPHFGDMPSASPPGTRSPCSRLGLRPGALRSPPRVALVATLVLVSAISFSAPTAAATAAVVAEINGEVITDEEVEKALGGRLQRLEEQIYQLKRQKLEELIDERLLAREAATRGVSVQALLESEVDAKTATVTDEDVERFYEANKNRLRGDETALRDQIRGYLQIQGALETQKVAETRNVLLQSLRKGANVVVHLKEPPVARVVIPTEGAPFLGPTDAPVTIVEFSDFHCPFCKQVLPSLMDLRSRYGDKVKLVFRDFPLDRPHPQARRAAEAARCAHDQNKFWEYHDVLFANAPQASPEQLKAYAEQVGLDVQTFERCLASGTHAAAVQRDVDEGNRLGVSGTPHFFINGRPLSGAQPLERFVRVVDDELRRAR